MIEEEFLASLEKTAKVVELAADIMSSVGLKKEATYIRSCLRETAKTALAMFNTMNPPEQNTSSPPVVNPAGVVTPAAKPMMPPAPITAK